VLVGEYAVGDPSMPCPPTKNAAGDLYDSCVDSVSDLTIFVTFNPAHSYLTYSHRILEIEKVHQINQLNRADTDVKMTQLAILTSSHFSALFYSIDTWDIQCDDLPIVGSSNCPPLGIVINCEYSNWYSISPSYINRLQQCN